MSRRDDDLDRSFEGAAVLQKLLAESGTLADVDDVADAFRKAVADGVPAPVVIQALWEDEPRFASPDHAARLFGNLLGLFELVASGKKLDLEKRAERVKREKAPRPEPFGSAGPDDAFVEAAWRWFDDFPKERQRHEHAFENRQDALVSWLDEAGLSDAGFGLARHLVGEVFAMLELGGAKVKVVDVATLPKKATLEALPRALAEWIDESLEEAVADEVVAEAELPAISKVVSRAVSGVWGATG